MNSHVQVLEIIQRIGYLKSSISYVSVLKRITDECKLSSQIKSSQLLWEVVDHKGVDVLL